MRFISNGTFVLALTFFIPGCNESTKTARDSDITAISKDSLIQHIQVLASDSFQGRRPFTEGEKRTVDYLQKSFASLGLEPGNNGSYFQEVPMVEITPDCDPQMTIETPKKKISLKNMDDYVIWTENTDSVVSLNKEDLIFAGFGVVAPEYNWNDYAGIDVKGKVVLVMVNDPGFTTGDTTLFKGKTMTYYGRWTYKFEEAARQGAKGCLVIHQTAAASYPFSVVQNAWGKAQLHLDPRGSKQYRCPIEGWLTNTATQKILNAAGYDSTLFIKANQRGFKAIPLKSQASTSMRVKAVFNTSRNVIAKITGTSAPDEYVIYTAHWDHFGIGKPDAKGDSIYNGALDNASGTASLLEIARAFKQSGTKPARSVVFLAVTAEEQGLLGSAYYATHPVYPAENTVADLNIDVINNLGKTKDITIAGAGQSELEDYLKTEVEKQGRYIAPESHPEAGHYFRSDHFNFAKAGIPALTTGSGVDDVTRGKEAGQKFEDEYNDHLYHQPADEYDAKRWNLEGGVQDLQLLYLVGKRLANETTWPKWKEGSEFKALRQRQ